MHPGSSLLWLNTNQPRGFFFPLSQHLSWQILHLWLVLESLAAVSSWKECPLWDMVNSSIHKSSHPPPPSSNAESPGYLCNLWYNVLSGVEKSTVQSVPRDGSHTSLLLVKHIRSPYISFFTSFLSLTLLLTFSKVRFFPFMGSLGSIFCPGRLVCVRTSCIPFFGPRANNTGGWGKYLLCAACCCAWHPKNCWSWTWERP